MRMDDHSFTEFERRLLDDSDDDEDIEDEGQK